MLLNLKNSSGDYLYTEFNPIYDKDSLKIFNEFGNQMTMSKGLALISNTPSTYWKFEFASIYDPRTDLESLNSEVCKKFILKYYHNQADTITTCFKVQETKCGSVFNPLKVYQRGILLTEVSNTALAEVTVTKN